MKERNSTMSNTINRNSFDDKKININKFKVRSQLRKSEIFHSYEKFQPRDIFSKEKRPIHSKIKKNDGIFTKQQINKMVNKNYYTIHFSDPHLEPSHQNIANLQTALKLLIKQSLFNSYKQNNKQNGNYRQALEEFGRQNEKQIFKFSIKTGRKVKTDQNLYEIEKDFRGQQINRHSRPSQTISKHIHRFSDNINMFQNSKKLSMRRPKKDMSIHLDKWNLNDFFDPIIQKVDVESEKNKFRKERLDIMQKLQNITKKCSLIEEEDQVTKSVNLFQKFIEDVDHKLIKKKRKLEKVYFLKI